MILILSIYQIILYSIIALATGFLFAYLTITLLESNNHPIQFLQKLLIFILNFFKSGSSFIEILETIISFMMDLPIRIITLFTWILTSEFLAKFLLWISNIFLLDFSKLKINRK